MLGLLIVLLPSDAPVQTAPTTLDSPVLPAAGSTPEPLAIDGAWDSGEARSIVLDSLAVAAPTLCEEPCTEHRMLGEYFLRHGSGDAVIVVAASTFDGYTCSACSLPLSLFEFRRVEGGWRLESAEIGAVAWGMYGNIDPEQVNVFAIGVDTYGVFLDLGATQMGEAVTVTSIQARILDSFREILSLRTSSDDSGAYYTEEGKETIWTSEIDVRETNTGFYDLAVTRRGSEEGIPFEETGVYKFNGQGYVLSDTFR